MAGYNYSLRDHLKRYNRRFEKQGDTRATNNRRRHEFKGAVLAWSERPELDGTSKQLKDLRVFVKSKGYLTEKQRDVISDRFKTYEEISPWLQDMNTNRFSKFKRQFVRDVYLPPKAVMRIRSEYIKPKTMTQDERYRFWKNLPLKFTNRSSNANKKKPNLDGRTQLFSNGKYIKPNTYRCSVVKSKESDAYRMYKY
eukprot:689_1